MEQKGKKEEKFEFSLFNYNGKEVNFIFDLTKSRKKNEK